MKKYDAPDINIIKFNLETGIMSDLVGDGDTDGLMPGSDIFAKTSTTDINVFLNC